MAKKNSPTRRIGSKNGRSRPKKGRREKPAPPEIYVRIPCPLYDSKYAEAHLRNRRGYVELCWRENGRIRTFYLGKRKNPSPTDIRRPGPGPLAPRGLPRRGKISPRRGFIRSKS